MTVAVSTKTWWSCSKPGIVITRPLRICVIRIFFMLIFIIVLGVKYIQLCTLDIKGPSSLFVTFGKWVLMLLFSTRLFVFIVLATRECVCVCFIYV